ncbi:YbhB/YbcL family Raf kinase inhibitor-like protein [Candidatus Pacearchaeota archaeon]|nr:MAG: YbhB/YbcL family Raf kinase inhibitor-like protein [Candidatus Pacearchaeota archaeon]
MEISSPAFAHNSPIPSKYTCDGQDINPPLTFANVPSSAKELVLIVDDPDAPAGVWTHWVVYNIPPQTAGIDENSIPANAVQGTNSWGKSAYGGPCPPSGTHRYFFKLYALNSPLQLSPGASKTELENAMQGKVIASAELVGTYTRQTT